MVAVVVEWFQKLTWPANRIREQMVSDLWWDVKMQVDAHASVQQRISADLISARRADDVFVTAGANVRSCMSINYTSII